MAVSTAAPRIAVCGAGISGLTLSAILSRRMGSRVKISVFERAAADRDQGYGIDLDEHGQKALALAGVYHRYWEISRPLSDSAAIFPVSFGSTVIAPWLVLFRPKLLQMLMPGSFGAQPETNRAGLRDILLDALAGNGNARVLFETGAWDIKQHCHPDGRCSAELLDREGQSLGEFDLVIDAMGLHSTLRRHRVDDPVGIQPDGSTLIHGVINDPESNPKFPPQMLEMMGKHGTVATASVWSYFVIQRFGRGSEDNRTAFFYVVNKPGGDRAIFEETGVERPTSRNSGIISDSARLSKLKEWLHQDMGKDYDPLWHGVVESLDRLTVRDQQTHGDTTLRDSVSLPLVCIGDSLRNCGLGGGGNLAMQDAAELSELLLAPSAFDAQGRCDLDALRGIESEMLARKVEFTVDKAKRIRFSRDLLERDGRRPFRSSDLAELVKSPLPRFFFRIALATVRPLFRLWYRYDLWRGQAGSDTTSPIYPIVKKLL